MWRVWVSKVWPVCSKVWRVCMCGGCGSVRCGQYAVRCGGCACGGWGSVRCGQYAVRCGGCACVEGVGQWVMPTLSVT